MRMRFASRVSFAAAALSFLGLAGLAACETIEPPRRVSNRGALEASIQRFAARLESTPPSASEAPPRLREFMLRRLEITRITLAMADETGENVQYVTRIERQAGRLVETELDEDIQRQEWFALASSLGTPTWSAPSFHRAGMRVNQLTYSVPLFRGGRFMGVLAADVPAD